MTLPRLIFTYAPGSWVSRAIAWVSGGERVSHVGVQVASDRVIHADGDRGCVLAQSLNGALEHGERKVVATFEDARGVLDVRKLEAALGSPYDYEDAAAIGLLRRVWSGFRMFLGRRRFYTCTELVLRCSRRALVPEWGSLRAEDTLPSELLRAARSSDAFREVGPC